MARLLSVFSRQLALRHIVMSRVETDVHRQHHDYAASSMADTDSVDEDVANWYFWSKQTATRRDHYGSESITTVYAVKAAIGQKQYKGWSLCRNLGRWAFAMYCEK